MSKDEKIIFGEYEPTGNRGPSILATIIREYKLASDSTLSSTKCPVHIKVAIGSFWCVERCPLYHSRESEHITCQVPPEKIAKKDKTDRNCFSCKNSKGFGRPGRDFCKKCLQKTTHPMWENMFHDN